MAAGDRLLDHLLRRAGFGASHEDLATFGERRFTLAAELAKTMPAFPITRRHRVAQCRCLASPWPVL